MSTCILFRGTFLYSAVSNYQDCSRRYTTPWETCSFEHHFGFMRSFSIAGVNDVKFGYLVFLDPTTNGRKTSQWQQFCISRSCDLMLMILIKAPSEMSKDIVRRIQITGLQDRARIIGPAVFSIGSLRV